MANFILIRDSDRDRGRAAVLQARDQVAFLPRMQADLCLMSDHAVAWATAPGAPVSRHHGDGPSGVSCLLFGEPHDDDGKSVDAAALSARQAFAWDSLHQLNGYYAALMFDPVHGLRAEADVLGIFPIYYWQSGDVVLVASSPELFRCHPSFRRETDLHGIAALLLTSGMVGGRTLLQGVRRLGPDHVLLCPPGGAAVELSPPALEPGAPLTSLEEAVEEASALHRAFLRSALRSARQPGLQLSGGLDSRLLAGFVHELGHRPACLTFGRREDLDARCATQVAQHLAWPQTFWESEPGDYASYASSCVRQENLSGGLYSLAMGWNISVRPPPVEMDRMVCGLTLDAVIGGPKHTARADGDLAFEQLRIGRLGFQREQLARLVAEPALLAACEDIRNELVKAYRDAAPTDALREWRMNLAHRHRFAVGVCAWRFSLFSWPVLPALDRRLIRLAARLPHSLVEKRRVQTHMLITRFPELARLEIDRNYVDTFPILGPKLSPWGQLRRRLVRWSRHVQCRIGREPRFYVRTMEINGPGWRVVRRLADQARSSARELFKPDELAAVVPPADARIPRFEDPIIHSTPLKNTVGVMLWLHQRA